MNLKIEAFKTVFNKENHISYQDIFSFYKAFYPYTDESMLIWNILELKK